MVGKGPIKPTRGPDDKMDDDGDITDEEEPTHKTATDPDGVNLKIRSSPTQKDSEPSNTTKEVGQTKGKQLTLVQEEADNVEAGRQHSEC